MGRLTDRVLSLVASSYNDLSNESVIFVPPSGDTDGSTDADNIQAAIDALQAAVTDQAMGTVLLSGYYYTDTPLVCGVVNSVFSRVTIQGLGSTVINYAGSTYTAGFANYVIRMFGGRNGPKPLLSNLRLFCNSKCRGIHIAQPNGSAIIENVHVYGSIESAWDMIGCWWTNVRDCAAIEYKGFGARLYQCNGCTYDSMRFWVGVEDDAKWPSTSDTVCVTYGNVAYQTADAERSALYIEDSNSLYLPNLCFEACTYNEYPLVYMVGDDCLRNRITMMRLEDNINTLEKIKLVGVDHMVIDGICSSDGLPSGGDYELCDASVACECFIRCTGTTRGTLLNRLVGNAACTQHLIILDGGSHYGTAVTNCSTACAHIHSTDWIGTNGSPTVDEDWPDRTY